MCLVLLVLGTIAVQGRLLHYKLFPRVDDQARGGEFVTITILNMRY